MSENIYFFQSTSIGGTNNTPGILELLLAHLDTLSLSVFEQVQIIVPNQIVALWLKQQITAKKGICANVDCVVLPGPVFDNIYLKNNPKAQLFNFGFAKYIIYEYLCNSYIDDAEDINSYMRVDGVVDRFRAYELASELGTIFHEYIHLRTHDLLDLDKSNIKSWQKQIIKHLFLCIQNEVTFLDVYRYFLKNDLSSIHLPRHLIIFGLSSIYPSQLDLIKRLSLHTKVYWYYQTCSYEYYGDLLSDRAKSKLEQKLFKQPDLSLEDLYLQEGNPLLTNLAQQSREFSELLIASGIDVYNFKLDNQQNKDEPLTLLNQIQEDIRNITYRIRPDYRLDANSSIYADALENNQQSGVEENIYDLANGQVSIKVNICHNRMREVQVMFNELIELIDKNPSIKLDEILITAPDIDNYASYIMAVFDNEAVGKQNQHKLPYNITGGRKYSNYKILETLKLLLNAPYCLTVNYFMDILIQSEIQSNLDLNADDVETIRKWLYDNNTHFGYDENDYAKLGYDNYAVHSFKQFLNNIVLGSCISHDVGGEVVFGYQQLDNALYIPYDNLDNAQVKLCNKLIRLIDQLELLRNIFYADELNFNELCIDKVHDILDKLHVSLLKDKDSINCFNTFLGELLLLPKRMIVTLPILNSMLDEYIGSLKNSFALNGAITCISMRYARNIPFRYVYVLGLNFGEYPSSYTPNNLSILAKEWYLADRNYNIEDKQIFLDIILSSQERIYFSYIGRSETDNREVKPSPLLSLFINTLGKSFVNFQVITNNGMEVNYDYKNLVVVNALHPFYNNKQPNYSLIWHKISKINNGKNQNSKIWDFSRVSSLKLNKPERFYAINIKKLVNTFLYSNVNLYQALNLFGNNLDFELSDTEDLSLVNKKVAKQLFSYFEKYLIAKNSIDIVSLEKFLMASGVIGYEHIGKIQFKYYLDLYNMYVNKRGNRNASLQLEYKVNDDIIVSLSDEIYVEDTKIIVTEWVTSLYKSKFAENLNKLSYALKLKGIIIYLVWMNGALITSGENAVVIDGVVIREILIDGNSQDFHIRVKDPMEGLKRIFKYYIRSLTNPVLIHKKAIEAYASASRENMPINLCINKAKNTYLAGYENSGLDQLKQDLLWGGIAENYFEFIQKSSGVNDIIQIGNIIEALEIYKNE